LFMGSNGRNCPSGPLKGRKENSVILLLPPAPKDQQRKQRERHGMRKQDERTKRDREKAGEFVVVFLAVCML